MIKVVSISDTHTYHDSLVIPPGDILIHAGDFTFRGREKEVRDFGKWFSSIKGFKHKILIAGNHDQSFEGDTNAQALEWLYNGAINDSFIYLQDTEIVLSINNRQIKVYGTPWQPFFCDWAFNLRTPEELKAKWDLIPDDTDILLTHGPAYGYGDLCDHGERVGCKELKKAILRVKPKLHCFGHIHEAYGIYQLGDTVIANASICTVEYRPTNKPIIVNI